MKRAAAIIGRTVEGLAFQPTSRRARAVAYPAALVTLAVYLMFARTRTIAETFLLLRDQIRDWQIAIGPWSALPLTGPQSTAGGSSLGPIYYWLLWLFAHLFGPWTGGLPHAGAIGIAALQTAADLLLVHGIRRLTGSLPLALATVIASATASHDLALTATIWNPPVSVAFVKIAVAAVLVGRDRPEWWRTPVVVVPAWFAVQAHSAAVFVAAPIVALMVADHLLRRRWLAAFQQLRAAVEIILLLQVPFIYHGLTQPANEVAPTRVLGGAMQVLRDPGSARLGDSLAALVSFTGSIVGRPWVASGWWPLLLLCAVTAVCVRFRGRVAVLSVTVAPLAAAVAGFSLWPGAYDEYWYLPLVPSTVLTVTFGLTGGRHNAAALVLLLAALAVQPARLSHSMTWYRMPEYGAMSRGAIAIRRRTPDIRRLDTTFPVPALSDRAFLYRSLGGRTSPDAPFDAVIAADGSVRFVPVR